MRTLKLFFPFLLLCTSSFAQDLIPNGSFETGPDSSAIGWSQQTDSTCALFGNVAGPDDWVMVRNTPDRLVEGDINCDWDRDTAKSGRAFITFVYNEAGKTTLTMPLEEDSVYVLSYYASWQTFQGSATTPSQVRFSFNNGGNELTSPFIGSLQWQYYDVVFVASANSTEMTVEGLQVAIGGVNLDNLSLRPASYTDVANYSALKHSIQLFPNPYSTTLNITTDLEGTQQVVLYDAAARPVLQRTFSRTTALNTAALPKGFYFYKISNKKGVIKTGKVLKK
jgi:hypothetical protein